MLPTSNDLIRCVSLFQSVNGDHRYDNLLIFQILDRETGNTLPGKYAILTRGRWATKPDRPYKLDIHFREVSLRQIPIDLHDAYSTFRYLDDTDVPEVVRDEQIDFLSLVNNTTYSLDGVCTNDTSHPLPLSMRINVSAHSNITYMDEEGMRIMRGCRGGLYALIRSGEP